LAKEEKNWETDIRLIQKDITQIQKFFNKVDSSIDMMGELSKNVAVQHEVLEVTREKLDLVASMCEEQKSAEVKRINILNDRLEEYRASARDDHQRLADHNAEKRNTSHVQLMSKLDDMEKSLHARINDQTKKINVLENWRYYVMGIGAVMLFMLAKINWPGLFS
jgi:septum formation inhibitor MinC